MPTIQRLTKSKKEKNQRDEKADQRLLRHKAYNSSTWKKARAYYIKEHPLCEDCLARGIINAGSLEQPLNVHHIRSPFANNEINWALLGDTDNLMTLCPECHARRHNKSDDKTPEEILAELEELLK